MKRTNPTDRTFEELEADPKFSYAKNKMAEWNIEQIEHARNSGKILHVGGQLDLKLLEKYPNSPTAQRYLKAIGLFLDAKELLAQFKKETVETMGDCEYLKTVFHGYAKAHMCENSLYESFQPPDKRKHLIDQYLTLSPDDDVSQYLRAVQIVRGNTVKSKTYSDFSLQKENIVILEEFLHKISKMKDKFKESREIMTDVLYLLGSTYAITNQAFRAKDAFEKCYAIDQNNYSALFGVAYHYMECDKEKAVDLFKKYIQLAPECDKQYPHAYYTLSYLFLSKFKDESKAIKYYHKGVKAEEKRLPFMGQVTSPEKKVVQLMINLKT